MNKINHFLSLMLFRVSAVSIVLMMVITCIDIILRFCVTVHYSTKWAFLSPFKPVAGTYEVVCFLNLLAVSCALAKTALSRAHVAVTFVVDRLPSKMRLAVEILVTTFSLILFAILAWRSVIYSHHLRELNKVSEVLFIPFYPFAYILALCALVVCFIYAEKLYKVIVQKEAS